MPKRALSRKTKGAAAEAGGIPSGLLFDEQISALTELQHLACTVYRAIGQFNFAISCDDPAKALNAAAQLDAGSTVERLGELLDRLGGFLPTGGHFATSMGSLAFPEATACEAAVPMALAFRKSLSTSLGCGAGGIAVALGKVFANWQESKIRFTGAYRFDIQTENAAIAAVKQEIAKAKHRATDIAAKTERTADSKTDNQKKFPALVPDNPDVSRLAKKIKRDRSTGATKIDIALQFTNGNRPRAENLLRQLRPDRFGHLLDS